ncbi:MAG: ABC transporter ATP-binding protein [Polyangiaceae bacterium]|nr:ABC transporter ATP-binding protein [Polyangiaceae bacterium]
MYATGGLNLFATARLRLSLGFSLQRSILEKAIAVPYANFENASFYDALTRARREAVGRPVAMLGGLFAVGQACAVLVGSAILLFRFSPLYTVAILLAALPGFLTETRFATALFLFYAVYVHVAFRALQGTLTAGDLALALVTFRQGDGALKQALGNLRSLYMDQQYLGNLYDFLDTPIPARRPLLVANTRDRNWVYASSKWDSSIQVLRVRRSKESTFTSSREKNWHS